MQTEKISYFFMKIWKKMYEKKRSFVKIKNVLRKNKVQFQESIV